MLVKTDTQMIVATFRAVMLDHGIEYDGEFIPDDELHRFRPGDRKNPDAWYVFHLDGIPAGSFGDWGTGKTFTWCAKKQTDMTLPERAEYTRHVEAQKQKQKIKLKQIREEASQKALKIWETAQPATGDHPYLKRKQVLPYGVKVDEQGRLVVPAMDSDGAIHTLQTIRPDSEKRFLPGGAKRGHFFEIKGDTRTVYLCEGYATGASTHQATGTYVVVAFDAGNLTAVAEAIRKKCPNSNIVICADDDRWTDGNPGMTKAKAAAAAIGARVVSPEFKDVSSKPTDFNDLACLEGIEAVRLQLKKEPDNQQASEQPESDEQEPDEWAKARELFPRLPFPWEVLPEAISESLQQLARSHATSSTSLPGAAIAILSSVLGATIAVSPKASWKEPLTFWFGDIRPSGSGKTPAARALCHVLYDAQSKEDQDYKQRLEVEQVKKPKDRQPVQRARGYFVTDLTLEGLRADISGHGGTVCVMDELSSFLSGQNQYKSKGNDREAWLCLFDGKPARIARANDSVTITGARVNIFGGIQPRVWSMIFGGEKGLFLDDGTVYRFLPTYEGDQFYPLTSESWSEQNRKVWERGLSLAMDWADQLILGDGWKPKCLCLNEEAQGYFLNWRNTLYAAKLNLPDQLKGFLPKITAYALRFSGILYCIDQFSKGTFPGNLLALSDIEKGTRTALFYLGHIVDATQALCSKDRVIPFEITDQAKHLATTLEGLRGEVDSGRLAVGFIQEKYNSDCRPENQISSPHAMGGILRDNGLTVSIKSHDVTHATKKIRSVKCLSWDKKTDSFIKSCLSCLHCLQTQAGQGLTDADIEKAKSELSASAPIGAEPMQTMQTLKNGSLYPSALGTKGLTDNSDNADNFSNDFEKYETGTL